MAWDDEIGRETSGGEKYAVIQVVLTEKFFGTASLTNIQAAINK